MKSLVCGNRLQFEVRSSYLKSLLQLLLLLAITGSHHSCSQPHEVRDTYLHNSNPDNVVMNLVTSYQDKNLAEYLNCLSENFSFVLTDGDSWGKREEGMIHTKLFSQALTLELKLSPLQSSTSTYSDVETLEAFYRYDLTLWDSGEIVNHATGQLLFNLIRTESEGWLIKDWREINLETAKKQAAITDSIDYFPLHVGNYWIYEEQNERRLPDITTTVSDSVIINNKTYYDVAHVMIGSIWGYSIIRKDPLGNILALHETDSSDVLIYDFTADVGDTLSFPTQKSHTTQAILQLLAKNGALETPAGTFDDVILFASHYENVGNVFVEYIAPSIGTIAFAAEGEFWALMEARIDTLTIPDVSVGVRKNAWEEIKRYYLAVSL